MRNVHLNYLLRFDGRLRCDGRVPTDSAALECFNRVRDVESHHVSEFQNVHRGIVSPSPTCLSVWLP